MKTLLLRCLLFTALPLTISLSQSFAADLKGDAKFHIHILNQFPHKDFNPNTNELKITFTYGNDTTQKISIPNGFRPSEGVPLPINDIPLENIRTISITGTVNIHNKRNLNPGNPIAWLRMLFNTYNEYTDTIAVLPVDLTFNVESQTGDLRIFYGQYYRVTVHLEKGYLIQWIAINVEAVDINNKLSKLH